MAGAAVLQASTPAILHLSASGSNPLMFHVVLLTAEVALLAAVLAVVAVRAGPAAGSMVGVLRDADVHLCYFRRGGPSQPLVVMRTARVGAAAGWGRLPLLWVCVGSSDYALLAWATSFAETAAVVALYGLWPLWLVWMLSRRAAPLRTFDRQDRSSAPPAPRHGLLLGAGAGAGVVLVLASQSGTLTLGRTSLSGSAALGALLGCAAGCAAAGGIAASMTYGRAAYERLRERAGAAEAHPAPPRGPQTVLWLTMLGVAAVRAVNAAVSFAAALLISRGMPVIDAAGVAGAVLLGVVLGAATILLRVANLKDRQPAANMLLLASPVVGLGLLVALGVSLPRFDLFVAGAALIVVANILIQIRSTHPPAAQTGH